MGIFGFKRRKAERKAFDDMYDEAKWDNAIRDAQILNDRIRALEMSLTDPQRAWAYQYAASQGWYGEAPNFVWSQIFSQASQMFLDKKNGALMAAPDSNGG